MKQELFEITTKARVEPSISSAEMASAFLDESEVQACYFPMLRLSILDRIVMAGTEKTYHALLEIIDPVAINEGKFKVEKLTYFKWSVAKQKITRKHGLSDISLVGSRTKVSGMRISSVVANDNSHRQKFVAMVRLFKKKLPHIRVTWEDCVHAVACEPKDIEEMKAATDPA